MFVSLKLVAQPFLLGPTISSFAAFYLLSPPASHSLPFSRITEKKSLGIWMGTWKCCPRSFMSFVRYLALEGSRAGGLFPKSGNLDPLVRDLRIPDLGDPCRVLGSTPPGPWKSVLPQIPAPSAASFIPLLFMIPAMKVGRNCRWTFQMFLYRHRICRSRGEGPSPCARWKACAWQRERQGCCMATG